MFVVGFELNGLIIVFELISVGLYRNTDFSQKSGICD